MNTFIGFIGLLLNDDLIFSVLYEIFIILFAYIMFSLYVRERKIIVPIFFIFISLFIAVFIDSINRLNDIIIMFTIAISVIFILATIFFIMYSWNSQVIVPGEIKGKVKWFVSIAVVLVCINMLRFAWLSDDGMIFFRTIDNFVNCRGLLWNPGERVQTFTSPLWLMMESVLYFFIREPFIVAILIGVFFSVLSVILLFKIKKGGLGFIVCIAVLLSSKAFIDYTTSGLENPLSNFLLGVFFMLMTSEIYKNNGLKEFLLILIASFAFLTRQDTLLIYLPLLITVFYNSYRKGKFIIAVMGLLPAVMWEIFSLIYYGFPFPNTFYAKINTGINLSKSVLQGLKYFYNSIKVDPVTLLFIFFSVIYSLYSGFKKHEINPRFLLSVGIIFYLIYILRIGGDFMSGRFFNTPLFASMLVIPDFQNEKQRFLSFSLFACIMFAGLAKPDISIITGRIACFYYEEESGICLEREYYFLFSSLRAVLLEHSTITSLNKNVKKGLEYSNSDDKVFVLYTIGYEGYYAGYKKHIIDYYALSDPLLSRLPALSNSRIGHFGRNLPKGYMETIISGKNMIVSPALRNYYEPLHLIVRGKIFNTQRLIEILKFNTGFYNKYLDTYLKEEQI